ncbi:hypothetical protein BASA61_002330 [Batrachochytrium salamandrivorans]|nr:hypothetical protein BASA60_005244 [Batrachochytrium salamandrivorans]KAH6600327.1 hypothetical protein BASA61_002330 [Batrachochytrium salamandrivorans]KAH9266240.1 hypothetical protein BASA83_010718 [Batrachochytrium salamandrivorans]
MQDARWTLEIQNVEGNKKLMQVLASATTTPAATMAVLCLSYLDIAVSAVGAASTAGVAGAADVVGVADIASAALTD